MTGQQAVDVVGEVFVDKVMARDVHAHLQSTAIPVKPSGFGYRLIEDGMGEQRRESGTFCHPWTAPSGKFHPPGMWPTDEGFDTADPACAEINSGLIVQGEGLNINRVAQCVEQGKALSAVGVSVDLVNPYRRANLLGFVHGDICATQKLIGGWAARSG